MMIWMVLSREPTATVRLVGRVTSDHSAGESKTSLGSSDAVAVASTTAGGAGNWLDLSVEVCKVDAGDADHCSWDDAAFFAETPQTPSLPPPPPPPPRGGGGAGGGGGGGHPHHPHHHHHHHQQANQLDVLLGNPNLHNSSQFPRFNFI